MHDLPDGCQWTSAFEKAWQRLPVDLMRRAAEKVRLLVESPAHPSLHVHPAERCKQDVSICYVTRKDRLLFRREGETLLLLDIGSHAIVDRLPTRNKRRAHRREG